MLRKDFFLLVVAQVMLTTTSKCLQTGKYLLNQNNEENVIELLLAVGKYNYHYAVLRITI